jgi:acyl-CoA reductase-like NAD-dependent aldehyde dehydrogenase
VELRLEAKGDYIGGRFVKPRRSARQIPSVDPGDSKILIGDFPVFPEAIGEALALATVARATWSALDCAARMAFLPKLKAQLRNRTSDLVELMTLETGRPRWETRDEVRLILRDLDQFAALSAEILRGPSWSVPTGVTFQRQGIGLIAVLAPYAHPALSLIEDCVAALIAGCPVVAKPSSLTPAIGQTLAEIFDEVDLPKGVFALIQGDNDIGRRLALHPQIDGVLLRGRATTAFQFEQALTRDSKKLVRLLAAGRPTALVLDDADLDDAAYKIAIGVCLATGQGLYNTRHVLVHERVADYLRQKIVRLLGSIAIGHGQAHGTFMGPMIGSPQVDRYLQLVNALGAEETTCLRGQPLNLKRRGYYVSPTIIELQRPLVSRWPENREAIGPIVTLRAVSDMDQVADELEQFPYSTSLAVHGRRVDLPVLASRTPAFGFHLHNAPTTCALGVMPHQTQTRGGHHLAGLLTLHACSRLQALGPGQENLDATMLPPGIPPLR